MEQLFIYASCIVRRGSSVVEQPFEKLGVFYLGRVRDLERNTTTSEYVLYDSKDLTTHALCVGMTGSGKTGLCISLLEEAGIDGIPAIVVDPKGDIGNLLLTFPELLAEDFRPWVDEAEAARQARRPTSMPSAWRHSGGTGLAEWGQDGERIRRFRSAVELAIYTPGSSAGVPLTILKSFAAPPAALVDDVGRFSRSCGGRHVRSAGAAWVSMRIRLRSREFILVSNLLDRAWREQRNMDLAGLIHQIQAPPFCADRGHGYRHVLSGQGPAGAVHDAQQSAWPHRPLPPGWKASRWTSSGCSTQRRASRAFPFCRLPTCPSRSGCSS